MICRMRTLATIPITTLLALVLYAAPAHAADHSILLQTLEHTFAQRLGDAYIASSLKDGPALDSSFLSSGSGVKSKRRFMSGLPADLVEVEATHATPEDDGNYSVDAELDFQPETSFLPGRFVRARIHVLVGKLHGRIVVLEAHDDNRGLAALDHPIVVQRDRVTVLAEDDRSEEADRIAVDAERLLPELEKRYDRVQGGVFLTVVERLNESETVLGFSDALTGDEQGVTYGNGDVIISGPAYDNVSSDEQLDLVRHELTHLTTLGPLKHLPTILSEGVATYEQTVVRGTAIYEFPVESVRDGLRTHDLDLTAMLTGKHADEYNDYTYSAGYQLWAALEDHAGHAAMVRFLHAVQHGTKLERAFQEELDLSLSEIDAVFATWVASSDRLT